jgi:membrane protease YdiL (CAAX protease family)
MRNNKVSDGKIINHPITKIFLGLLIICLIIPAAIKIAILSPLFSLFNLAEDVSKSIQAIFSIAVILATYILFFKRYEKRKIEELSTDSLLSHTLLGFFTGFVLILMVIAVFYLIGYYKPLSLGHYSVLIKAFVFLVLMGIWEEIAFRGIIYRITEKSLGTVWALIITSLIFGFFHLGNDNFNIFSGFAIALEIGLLTGISYTLTKRLWFPIALHVGWNFSLIFWGTTVSGATEFSNYIESNLVGPELITGGKFGPENSIMTILFSLIVFGVLYFQTSKKGFIIKKRHEKSN